MVKEGNKAPDFSGKNQEGQLVKLSSFKGKKNIILYFYPKDDDTRMHHRSLRL